jgi:hypothetical protein
MEDVTTMALEMNRTMGISKLMALRLDLVAKLVILSIT